MSMFVIAAEFPATGSLLTSGALDELLFALADEGVDPVVVMDETTFEIQVHVRAGDSASAIDKAAQALRSAARSLPDTPVRRRIVNPNSTRVVPGTLVPA